MILVGSFVGISCEASGAIGQECAAARWLRHTDGSDLADRAVEQGLALAKVLGSTVTAVTVTEPWTAAVSGEWAVAFPVEDYEKATAANAEKILDGVQQAAVRLGVTCDAVHVKDQYAAEAIVEEAKTRACDLIVMASHGRRGIVKFVLGSQATRVLAHSSIPLLICR
jgi:nucleotide-binding universal stress UspA family protein